MENRIGYNQEEELKDSGPLDSLLEVGWIEYHRLRCLSSEEMPAHSKSITHAV